jgi:nucleotide-binding universal stress UspA family protein
VLSVSLGVINMIKITNVVVATDFGEASGAALAYGREFARAFGAKLHVLHVIEDPALYAGPESVGVDIARLLAELEAKAQAALDKIVTAEDRAQLKAVTTIRSGNAPAYEIVSHAKLVNSDVIIMGTHGRGFMAHLLMGSVAEKVVRTAPCPVLTVHHPEHEFILPDALELAASRRQP